MVIGLLICTIGIIPIVLALTVRRFYKGTELSFSLLIYMVFISVWQFDIGILYLKGFFSEKTIFMLFRIFRFAITYSIPISFYIAFVVIKKHTTTFNSGDFINKVLAIVFTKKMFIWLIAWSTFIYTINWTPLGLKGLKIVSIYHSKVSFYFPEYGPIFWLYVIHMSSFILFLSFIFLLSRKILNPNIRDFLTSFSFCSLLLVISGFINFSPATGAIASSIGVIIFSVIIMLSFVNLNHVMAINYNSLLERQKKLDYTGNLAGSLIHEVKNSIIIIKGFTNILSKSDSLNKAERGSLEMIQRAAQQLEDLANNYREYIKHSNIEFKTEDLNQIIEISIHLSQEFTKEKNVQIEFIKKFGTLKAFVNKAYFQEVFINLIKNSSEAIPGDRINRKITIETDLSGENIIVNFYDTGKGIPPENWETIFDPFISSKSEGMGLGLPFVKKVIFEHRGDIRIVNSSPAGTHFQIQIPQFEFSVLN